MIILKRKFVDVELPSGVGMSGEYKLVVSGPDGEVRRELGPFPNIILDQGLNRLGTATGVLVCAIGTGTVTPAANQSGLQTQSAVTSDLQFGSFTTAGASPWWTGFTWGCRFAIGSLNGNYSEVGVGWASENSMFSRALILDAGGAPTTITVGPGEQLDVFYTLRLYPPLTDVVTTPTIGGVLTTVTTRACGAGQETTLWRVTSFFRTSSLFIGIAPAWSGSIGSVTGSPSGTPSEADTFTTNAYSNNSLTATGTATYGTTRGNVGRIAAVSAFWSMAAFQYGFSPAIAKDATKTLVLNMSVSWGRRP
jgi:hypothetical protein